MDGTTAQLTEGAPAPDFTLQTGDGDQLSLADLRGRRVVLYFYPKDDTPGCTREACAFRDLRSEFDSRDAEILGVSLDDPESHTRFSQKFGLTFRLLSDVDADVSKRYGVYVLKQRDGKEYMGIDRTTFLIDREGVLRKIYPKVTVDGHADAILSDLDAIE